MGFGKNLELSPKGQYKIVDYKSRQSSLSYFKHLKLTYEKKKEMPAAIRLAVALSKKSMC